MFTGIIEEIGTVRSIRGGGSGVVLDIEASKVLEGTATGDSIAVNGVCLTVTPGSGHFTADAMPETLRRTSLGGLRPGSKVNLERAMACGGRFGGHLVSGHVDACGRVADLVRDGIALVMRVSVPSDVLRYVARKGSVTLDGVSLTVASVSDEDSSFTVSLIPHTMASTTLHLLKPGSPVNVEVDMLARYVERLLAAGDAAPASAQVDSGSAGGGLTEEFLKKYGF
ncbi:MAG TPA: riboflavin synthase [Candidatus Coprenecus merdigallinarum]|nr:riboflavin synthase [Candidatus Coprenecus merdigallinarum]